MFIPRVLTHFVLRHYLETMYACLSFLVLLILWDGVYFIKECLSLNNHSSGNLSPQTVTLVINLKLGRINLDMIPNEILSLFCGIQCQAVICKCFDSISKYSCFFQSCLLYERLSIHDHCAQFDLSLMQNFWWFFSGQWPKAVRFFDSFPFKKI